MRTNLPALRSGAALLQELVLPVDCAGCGRAGPALCPACRARLRPQPVLARVGGLAVASGLVYDGVARAALLAFKNEGRTDLRAPLGAALRDAVSTVLDRIAGQDGRDASQFAVTRARCKVTGIPLASIAIEKRESA